MLRKKMGNSLACFSKKNQNTKIRKIKKHSIHSNRTSNGHHLPIIPPPPCISRSTSRKSNRIIYPNSSRIIDHESYNFDGDYIQEQARVAAALLLQHHHQNGTFSQFERSVSLRDLLNCSSRKQKRNNIMPRSSSSRRARSLSDSLLHQVFNSFYTIFALNYYL